MHDDEPDTGERNWGWDFGAILHRVPGVVELQAAGFTPAETLFGEVELALAWPEEHRREVLDTRFDLTGQEPFDDDERRLFLVRSPWPSIDLATTVKLLFRWLGRNEDRYSTRVAATASEIDKSAELAVAAEFFRQSETWIRAYRRGRVNKLR